MAILEFSLYYFMAIPFMIAAGCAGVWCANRVLSGGDMSPEQRKAFAKAVAKIRF